MNQNYFSIGRFTKQLLSVFVFALCIVSSVFSQTYVNGNLGTGATNLNGAAAPAGTTWHELQNVTGNTTETNALLGTSHTSTGLNNFALADDFTVPAGQTWTISTLRVYSLDQVVPVGGTTSPYTNIRVRIWNGVPDAVGSTIVYGDMTTNRFLSTAFTGRKGIFNSRVPTPGAATPNLPIFSIDATIGTVLSAGTYWVEWQLVTAANCFSLTSQTVGVRTLPGYNARQRNAATWVALMDLGNPVSAPDVAVDLPFSINYSSLCIAAAAPTVSASALNSCSGAPVTLTASGTINNSAGWKFYTASCGGTAIAGTNSIVVNPTVTTTYFARGEGGCAPNGVCGQVTVTVTPCTCLTPDVATICEGVTQRLSVSGAGTPGTGLANTGAIFIQIPDTNPAGITSSLPVSLPAGATVTSIAVNFTMTHTWDSDMSINLVAPNGTVLNLLSGVGGSADDFTNTTLTSVGTPPSIATGTAPFTGTFSPQSLAAVGPTGLQQTAGVTNFATFIAAANVGAVSGNWRLAMRDGAGGDLGILTNWNLNFGYLILPTAIWTGPTAIFSNPTGTPYVAGTQTNAVWVSPTATSTYTATIAAGPCAGANNVIVNVLPRPIVTTTPLTGCSPLSITASGAVGYAWSPALGLSATTGATVLASPTATTTYSVIGTGANGCTSVPVSSTVNSSPVTAVMSALAGTTFQINEGFTTVLPVGWSVRNNSAPVGTTSWFQGQIVTFPAFNGPTNSYAAANFQNTIATAAGDISTWLFTPVVNIKNGDIISFYTRTQDPAANTPPATFPDRLELRMSTNGASVNAGATNLSVGDFTTVILTVNPTLTTTGYPFTWTKFTATITGVTGTLPGRFAFRYFVTNGGGGANSDFIGVDQVEYFTPSSANCANTVNNIKADITGGIAPYTLVYSDGTTNTTFNNYASGTLITVAPAVSTTYSIVSVTGVNGCPIPAAGITGSAAITVTPAVTITTQPTSKTICAGANTTFAVVPNATAGTTYQWQENTVLAPGAPVWVNVTNAGVYGGATTDELTITGATTGMTGYSYRVLVAGFCGGTPTSATATLNVQTTAVGTATVSNASICANGNTSFVQLGTLTGGPIFTHNWQLSTNGGLTYTNIANGGVYSGATTSTLVITGAPVTMNGFMYRDSINTTGGCGFIRSTVGTLTVRSLPVVVISAAPITSLFPSLTSTLTAAVSSLNPGASPYAYQWFRNGAAVTGATANTTVVTIDGLGSYTVRVTDATGCVNGANVSTPASITIKDSATAGILFIYPSPNTGVFQVRYYTVLNDGSAVPGALNIYDSKGAKVFTRTYSVGAGYQPMRVDLGIHARGVYRVDVVDTKGNRLKTGSVMVF